MTKFKNVHEKDPEDPRLPSSLAKFRRAMFTVGLLLRHFDFGTPEVHQGLEVSNLNFFKVLILILRHPVAQSMPQSFLILRFRT